MMQRPLPAIGVGSFSGALVAELVRYLQDRAIIAPSSAEAIALAHIGEDTSHLTLCLGFHDGVLTGVAVSVGFLAGTVVGGISVYWCLRCRVRRLPPLFIDGR